MVDVWGNPGEYLQTSHEKAEFPMVKSRFFITFGAFQSHGDTQSHGWFISWFLSENQMDDESWSSGVPP